MRAASIVFAMCSALWLATPAIAEERATVIVVVGAPGDAAYAGVFEKWAEHWKKAAETGGLRFQQIGGEGEPANALEQLRTAVAASAGESAEPLWLVLLGHGTDDGKEPKFNLRGADLSAGELATMVQPVRRPLALICGFSASGAFLKPLSAPDRVIVCATRSGRENNFARVGGFLSEAIADPAADRDKDGATSLLEAWLAAARRVTEFYKNDGRLATEHSLLDDNADGLGTPADWFEGVRAVKRTKSNQPPDGPRAQQLFLVRSDADQALTAAARKQRDTLEGELANLREQKKALPEAEYFAQLEAIMAQIARLYHAPAAK